MAQDDGGRSVPTLYSVAHRCLSIRFLSKFCPLAESWPDPWEESHV